MANEQDTASIPKVLDEHPELAVEFKQLVASYLSSVSVSIPNGFPKLEEIGAVEVAIDACLEIVLSQDSVKYITEERKRFSVAVAGSHVLIGRKMDREEIDRVSAQWSALAIRPSERERRQKVQERFLANRREHYFFCDVPKKVEQK